VTVCADCGAAIVRSPHLGRWGAANHWASFEDTEDGRVWTYYCRMTVGDDGRVEFVDFHYPEGAVRRLWPGPT
jgi:hypothetical protein